MRPLSWRGDPRSPAASRSSCEAGVDALREDSTIVQSRAATVEEYLDELPPERRTVIAAVRDMIARNLPAGYRECMGFGMINYVIPLERYPKTYNGQPLGYVALAAQKNHFALYLMSIYADPAQEARLRDAFAKAGKKLDMDKSCVRFKKLDDLPLEALGELIAATPPESYIERYEAVRRL